MARYTEPKCRLCRREGAKLFLKGSRCYSTKCPIEKKGAVPPGQHGLKAARRLSDYGRQLREKQKAKKIYGVLERQFKNYFDRALKVKKQVGEVLLQLLESRLDNVVYRLGLAPSRSVARQLVSHGHILVDNKKVNISSYQVKPGQLTSVVSRSLKIDQIESSLKDDERKVPKWLSRKAAVGKMIRLPKREEVETDINEDLIIEFYSR
ncbi:MAG TPA: 30S ribosomal protein S4 [Candidatus Bathyarchaeia archaeon]|nr:30S ribosomal protein S4 [Candidatus Bathyarchaeia archaeon]